MTQAPQAHPARASTPRAHSIVVGLDGREHDADALELTRTLRGAFAGQIVLVHVLPQAPLLGRGMVEFQSDERREGLALLARAAATFTEPVETELLNPWPAALALERFALKRHASLIVLGSSHRKTLGRIAAGTVALRLLKGAPSPLAVAPVGYSEASPGAITRVGVAYDATSGSDKALQAAASASERLDVSLHVYHAIADHEHDEVERVQMIDSGKAILDRAREQLEPRMDPTVRELVGDPAAAISQAARDDGVGVLFVGSRGWGPVREELFGGVGGAILERAPCPVVLIPHDATPITG